PHAPATPPTYTLSLHDALPIYLATSFSAGPTIFGSSGGGMATGRTGGTGVTLTPGSAMAATRAARVPSTVSPGKMRQFALAAARDRKSTRLNSSHVSISYAVFC